MKRNPLCIICNKKYRMPFSLFCDKCIHKDILEKIRAYKNTTEFRIGHAKAKKLNYSRLPQR